MFINTKLEYTLLLIKSIGNRSFKALGSLIGKSGDTVKRRLNRANENLELLAKIAVNFFAGSKQLYLIIDDTLIKKIYSRYMQGSGRFYDTKIGRKIMAYKLLCSAITDGKYALPLGAALLFDKDLVSEPILSKGDLVKKFILYAKKLFPRIRITIILDGAFASRDFLLWCTELSIDTEVRMHSNRKVLFKGQNIAIRDIKELFPKGRHMARTIKALWHDIPLEITAQRRIDKHGAESIIYQAATFTAKPSMHVAIYKKRWPIEKIFRTTKQHLGLQECFSLNIDVQMSHITSVLLAYSLLQLECKNRNLRTPEDALRHLKTKNMTSLIHHMLRMGEIFGAAYA